MVHFIRLLLSKDRVRSYPSVLSRSETHSRRTVAFASSGSFCFSGAFAFVDSLFFKGALPYNGSLDSSVAFV